jgi:hypothetical protein
MTHELHPCRKVGGIELRFSTKSWSDLFVCPLCGNIAAFHALNRQKLMLKSFKKFKTWLLEQMERN